MGVGSGSNLGKGKTRDGGWGRYREHQGPGQEHTDTAGGSEPPVLASLWLGQTLKSCQSLLHKLTRALLPVKARAALWD